MKYLIKELRLHLWKTIASITGYLWPCLFCLIYQLQDQMKRTHLGSSKVSGHIILLTLYLHENKSKNSWSRLC
jgi:hypothetical protein